MSLRYKGALLSATPPTTSETGATGLWSLQQQFQARGSNNWPPNGPFWVEDVFSTYIYTGNNSTQTIDNGINLSGKGGLVWLKRRAVSGNNTLFDTNRGATKRIFTDLTNVESTESNSLTSFNSNGFSLGDSNVGNANGAYVSWTFRKQPKFFDVVTYTGTGSPRTVAHNLGSVPGCIIIKRLTGADAWQVYHRSLGPTKYLFIGTAAANTDSTVWNDTQPTSTNFTVGTEGRVNASGASYVAYVFAHDAGGFGFTNSDNVITCGSYTGNGSSSGPTITLGYEPQWLLIKNTTTGGYSWQHFDTMRGFARGSADTYVLSPDSANAESSGVEWLYPTPTGFKIINSDARINENNSTFVYIAIRRGGMKQPTTGTSVFSQVARAGSTGTSSLVTTTNVPDVLLIGSRTGTTEKFVLASRLTASSYFLTNATYSEQFADPSVLERTTFNKEQFKYSVGNSLSNDYTNDSSNTYINYALSRAAGFLDVVTYTGTGSAQNITHNLTVVPEMMWVKKRSGAASIYVYTASMGNTLRLLMADNSAAASGATAWNSTTPTSSVFTVGTASDVNENGGTFIAWLFASIPGVSKVGSYTGNNSSNTITTGFSPRFIMIKRRDSTGNWYLYDTARGITTGNDPYLLLDVTNPEVTTTNYIETSSTGFVLNNAPAALNANGGTFIYYAIA